MLGSLTFLLFLCQERISSLCYLFFHFLWRSFNLCLFFLSLSFFLLLKNFVSFSCCLCLMFEKKRENFSSHHNNNNNYDNKKCQFLKIYIFLNSIKKKKKKIFSTASCVSLFEHTHTNNNSLILSILRHTKIWIMVVFFSLLSLSLSSNTWTKANDDTNFPFWKEITKKKLKCLNVVHFRFYSRSVCSLSNSSLIIISQSEIYYLLNKKRRNAVKNVKFKKYALILYQINVFF